MKFRLRLFWLAYALAPLSQRLPGASPCVTILLPGFLPCQYFLIFVLFSRTAGRIALNGLDMLLPVSCSTIATHRFA